MAGFKGILISLILAGLFIFALFSFAIDTANNNDADINIANNSQISNTFDVLDSQLNTIDDVYQNQSDSFAGTDPDASLGNILIVSIAGIWAVLQGIPVIIYNSVIGLGYSVLFGGTGNSSFAIVIASLGAILSIIITLLAWKLIRQGEPD